MVAHNRERNVYGRYYISFLSVCVSHAWIQTAREEQRSHQPALTEYADSFTKRKHFTRCVLVTLGIKRGMSRGSRDRMHSSAVDESTMAKSTLWSIGKGSSTQ